MNMARGGEEVIVLLDRLETMYGRIDWSPRLDPLNELVCCILSQHSNDKASFPAFDKLKATYPEWQDAVDAGPEQLAEIVRAAGLANQKSRNIIACLLQIREEAGSYSLGFLNDLPDDEARKWLLTLPGVGQKTAAIVLSFALGRDIVPVDTHVFRVSWRLGLIPRSAGESKAHGLLDQIVPKGLAFRFHMALINHGRSICKAPTPLCFKCPVTDMCDFFRMLESKEAA